MWKRIMWKGALAPRTFAVLLLAGIAGCDMEIIGGGGGEIVHDRFSLTVTVTNVGTGFGRAEITFPAGTLVTPCTEVIGPGESCSAKVTAPLKVETAEIDVSAEPGSRFIGWTGSHCAGTSTECSVQELSGERDASIEVEPRFDLRQ